jgi:hypothetical protein
MVLFALILMSDWETLSKKIQEQVSADDLSDSSGDDGSCSSSRNSQHQAVYMDKAPTLPGCCPCKLEITNNHCCGQTSFSAPILDVD